MAGVVDFLVARRAASRVAIEAAWLEADSLARDVEILDARIARGTEYVNAHRTDAKARGLLADLRQQRAVAHSAYEQAFAAYEKAEDTYLLDVRECRLMGAPEEDDVQAEAAG